MAGELAELAAKLDAVIGRTTAIRDDLRELAPLIRVSSSDEATVLALQKAMATLSDLLANEQAVHAQVMLQSLSAGDLCVLGERFDRLREHHQAYRDGFNEMWRAAAPLLVRAALQEAGSDVGSTWQTRWGPVTREIIARIHSRLTEADQALLTLRYLGKSLNEVARTLNVSGPYVFGRQGDMETDLAKDLVSERLRRDAGMRLEDLPDQRSTRLGRYVRLAKLVGEDAERLVLFHVLPPDEASPRPQSLSKDVPLVVVLYWIGADELRCLDLETYLTTSPELWVEAQELSLSTLSGARHLAAGTV